MPATPQQLLQAATYAFNTVAEGDPIDQVAYDLKTLDWFMKNKAPSKFTGGTFSEKVRLRYDSNAQRIQGDDQLVYNSRHPVRLAPFQAYGLFDGFHLTEEDLRNKGLTITRDSNGKEGGPTRDEAKIIMDTMKEHWEVLRLGKMQSLSFDILRDGTHDTKAPQGLDALVSTTPTVGTIGGIDASAVPLWRNHADMGISTATAGNLVDRMEIGRRATLTRGKLGAGDAIFCGSLAYDAFRRDARAVNSLQVSVPGSGGVSLDPATNELRFHGTPVVWDPAFDALDDLLGAITHPWKKRIYMLNSKSIKMRPVEGRWMQKIMPAMVYNRLVHHYGLLSEYGISARQRSANAVFSIA
jgi:hypothetical protein